MRLRKLFRVILFVILVMTLLCDAAFAKIRVGVVLPATIDDVSWGQALYEGLNKVKAKMGDGELEISISERLNNPVDAAAAVRQYASKGFDVIFAHGAQYLSLVSDIAPDFPQTTFAYGTGFATPHPNVFVYNVYAEQGAYLLGIIGEHLSKSKILGVVVPIDAGSPSRLIRGFEQGAKSVNPKVEVRIAFTGSFSDTVAAGEIARTHMKAGADFIVGTSQQGVGALKAASERPGVMYVCSDLNPKALAPATVLGAEVYNFEMVVERVLTQRAAGKLGGEFIPMSLANGGLYMEYNLPVPAEAMAKVDAAKADIASGNVKINIKK